MSVTNEHILLRTGVFVRYLGGLDAVGANENIYTLRYRHKGETLEFNVGLEKGIKFGSSQTGCDGLFVDPNITLDQLSPDGRAIVQAAVVPLDAQIRTHEHADHFMGDILALLLNPNYRWPLTLGPSGVRHKYIDEAKKAGVHEDLIRRYFGTHDEAPSEQFFRELRPYEAMIFEKQGSKLEILPVCLPHSTYGSLSYFIKAPNGMVYLHLSDFKSDMSIYPNGIDPWGLESVPQLFEKPEVRAFLQGAKLRLVSMESTNALKDEIQVTEQECHDFLLERTKASPRRQVCFVLGGNHPRYFTLADIAKTTNRLLEVVGEANKDAVRHISRAGEDAQLLWMNIRARAGKMVWNGSKTAARLYAENPASVLTVASGPNGEYIANLAKALDGAIDAKLKLDPKKDDIVICSSIIPGNEERVLELIGKARRKGFHVVMPPLSHINDEARRERCNDELEKIKKMRGKGSLTIDKRVHSSGHDHLPGLLALAKACPDQPYFACIHGGPRQRTALEEALRAQGHSVVQGLDTGCTVPVPDKRLRSSTPVRSYHEFPLDIFRKFTRHGGFGEEGAYQFGAENVTPDGIRLLRPKGRPAPVQTIIAHVYAQEIAGLQLNVINSGAPVRYEGEIQTEPDRLYRPVPKPPRVRPIPRPANSNPAPGKKEAA